MELTKVCIQVIFIPCLLKGKDRMRLPDEEKIALVRAGAASGTATSPTPPISLPLSIISTEISGEPFSLRIE